MQLELALSDSHSAAPMLWERLDPEARQAVIDRLALAIAKAVLPPEQLVESGDE
jgi:hypothetical protein